MAESTQPKKAGTPQSSTPSPAVPNIAERNKQGSQSAPVSIRQGGVVATTDTNPSPKAEMSNAQRKPSVPTVPVPITEDRAGSLEVKRRPDLTALKKLLCKRAGNRIQHDELLRQEFNLKRTIRLITEGTFITGENAIQFQVNMGNLHLRAIILGADPRAQRWSGFALGGDGGWRSHSWVVRIKDNRVIETTKGKFILYFGVQEPVPAKYMKPYAGRNIADHPVYKKLFEGP